MKQHWYYQQNGGKLGPWSGSELQRLASAGFIQPTTLVWKEGLAEWIPASRLRLTFSSSNDFRDAYAGPQAKSAGQDSVGSAGSASAPKTKTADHSLSYAIGSLVGTLQAKGLVWPVTVVAVLVTVFGVMASAGIFVWRNLRDSRKVETVYQEPMQRQVVSLAPPIESERDRRIAERKGKAPIGYVERHFTVCVGGLSPNRNLNATSVYKALIERANREVAIAIAAYEQLDDDAFRRHSQRAADYKFAADFFCEQGEFPPGFDADLATK